jgi:hypothetical protein
MTLIMNFPRKLEYLAKKYANGIPIMHRIDVEIVAVNRLKMNAFQTCGRVNDSRVFTGSKKVKTVVRGNTIYARVIAERTKITTLNPRCINSIQSSTKSSYSDTESLFSNIEMGYGQQNYSLYLYIQSFANT